MKDILNLKIKRRESFRPFAPSVLREAVGEWFELDGDVPFMMQVYPIRPEKRLLIPAVTHVDGTGRLQTVTAQDNDRFYRLIKAFSDLTGVPMVLNTSFNENEPIVASHAKHSGVFCELAWIYLYWIKYSSKEPGLPGHPLGSNHIRKSYRAGWHNQIPWTCDR